MKNKVILASASPRRLEIMKRHGIDPVVMPADADETVTGDPSMTEVVEELSRRKALACRKRVKADPRYAGYVIVAADTIVYKDEIMGKPADAEDARRMLRSYRGTYHYVVPGVTLIDIDSGHEEVLSDVTRVWCRDYSDEDIEEYISGTEPYDKAGAYAIQGDFGRYIDRIEGDYENVVGFPYKHFEKELNI